MRFILTCILCLAVGPFWLAGQTEQTFFVHFYTDSHALDAQAHAQLDDIAARTAGLDYRLDIWGHTDGRGSAGYNQALAERRADAVRGYLAAAGITVERTVTEAFGKARPMAPNDDDQGRQLNRRVEVRLTVTPLHSTNELLNRIKGQRTQRFRFDADSQYLVQGEHGTRIWVDPGSFRLPDGSPAQGELCLHLEEYYDRAGMVGAQLPTRAGDRLLETGGMLRVEVFAGDTPLTLDPASSLTIGMPAEQPVNDMLVFGGVTDAQGRVTDWTTDQTPFSNSPATLLRIPKQPLNPRLLALPTISYNYSTYPKLKAQPRTPVKPRLPLRDQVHYRPPFVKRMLMGKSKIKAHEDRIFAEKMADYERRLPLYETALAQHQQDLLAYETVKAEHREAVAVWKAEQDALREELTRAKQAEYDIENKARLAHYEQQMEAWRTVRERRIAEYEAQFSGATDAKSLNTYFGQVSQLGWINCDRFLNAPLGTTTLLVQGQVQEEVRVFAIFKSMNSILPLSQGKAGLHHVSGVPKGSELTLLAVKVEGGRAMMSLEHTTATDTRSYALDFKPASLADIRACLSGI